MSMVLEQIKKALRVASHSSEADARLNTVFAKSAGWSAPVVETRPESLPDLVARIRVEAGHLNLHVHECASLDTCGAELVALALARPAEWGDARRIMSWNDPLLRALGLEERLRGTDIGLAWVPNQERFTEDERAAFRGQVIASYIGLTTADYLIADTASLVLLGGRGRARSVSLVPSIHVAVVPMGRIAPSFRDVLRRLDAQGLALPSNLTFVTGPSKTADIEATLVHGAHGPREMHLFLVP